MKKMTASEIRFITLHNNSSIKIIEIMKEFKICSYYHYKRLCKSLNLKNRKSGRKSTNIFNILK
jgi:hypothetical protein